MVQGGLVLVMNSGRFSTGIKQLVLFYRPRVQIKFANNLVLMQVVYQQRTILAQPYALLRSTQIGA